MLGASNAWLEAVCRLWPWPSFKNRAGTEFDGTVYEE
jgi:hypothetical protein